MSLKLKTNDHTAATAQAFFIAGLLFVGIFYIALIILNKMRYKTTTEVAQHHLKQTLLAGGISLGIFITINLLIVLTTGYASVTGLFLLEFYYMIVVPVFLIMGILGFTKAVKNEKFSFPLIGRLLKQA